MIHQQFFLLVFIVLHFEHRTFSFCFITYIVRVLFSFSNTAYDNEGDTFGLILYRSSDMSAGIGTATYIKTSGKYKKFEGKNCTYAISYLADASKGFYKHICK